MYFPAQTFLVAGLSRSGIAAARYLLGCHAKAVYLYDDVDDENVRAARESLVALGCHALTGEDASARALACDVLVLSPGIPIDHPLPVSFRKAGKAIVGEAELGARALRCPVIAVTGTNGKTTTKELIAAVMKRLPPDEALLLTLYYLEECSVEEVCQITGLTVSNVKVKLFRGRKHFYGIVHEKMKLQNVDI